MLPIAEGADFGVQIIRGPRYIDLEIHFDKNKMINEKFEVDSLFPDSIFTEKGIAISKENIICFNKKMITDTITLKRYGKPIDLMG